MPICIILGLAQFYLANLFVRNKICFMFIFVSIFSIDVFFQTCREESTIQVSEEACLSVRNIGQYLISQTKGGVITVWEDKDGHWHTKSKICFEYWGFCKLDTLSGKYLVVPTSGSKVNIMSLEGETVNMLSPVLEKTCGEIMCLKCLTLSDTNYVFVLYECGLLILFESNGRLVSQIEITSDCPMALDFDGESKGVIGTSGNTLAGFLIQSQLTLSKWTETVLTNPGVSSVAVRPDKKLVAAGCWDSRIRLFSMKSLRLLVVVISHRESIQDICYSPARVEAWNSSWLLAASGKDGRVTLWNLY